MLSGMTWRGTEALQILNYKVKHSLHRKYLEGLENS